MGDLSMMLQANMGRFSKGQKRIAQYLLACADQAAFLTASQLGAAVQVSESTVIRFASELGFAGYPQMQKALRAMAMQRLRSAPELDRTGGQDAASLAIQADLELLQRTSVSLDRAAMARAAETLGGAKQIYVLGGRMCSPLAQLFADGLHSVSDRVQTVVCGDVCGTLEQLVHAGPADAVLGICLPPNVDTTMQALSYCRSRGAAVIVLTEQADAPAAADGDIVLTACSRYQAPVQSMTAALSVLQALLIAVAEQRGGALAKTQAAIREIRENYHD